MSAQFAFALKNHRDTRIKVNLRISGSSPFYRLGTKKRDPERFPKGNGIKDS